jgi:hypothetical protein
MMDIFRRLIVCSLVASLAGVAFAGDPPPDPASRLKISTSDLPVDTEDEISASVLMDTTIDGTQGWSFGVGHNPEELMLLGAANGALTDVVNDGSPPQFLVTNTAPDGGRSGVTMAVVFNFVLPITVAAGTDYELLVMDYVVLAEPPPQPEGDEECVDREVVIGFDNELGDPPVAQVVTINGESTVPELVDGSVTLLCPAPPGTLTIVRCEGDTENIYLEWENGGMTPWDFLFLYKDAEFLTELPIDATSFTDEGLEPREDPYEYTLVTFTVNDADDPQIVFAYCNAEIIPVKIEGFTPNIGYFIGGDLVTITGTGFTTPEATSLVFFSEDEDPLPLTDIQVISENEMTALTPASPRLGVYSVRVENDRGTDQMADVFDYGFIRGEVNADGQIDLSDGVVILSYLFLPGSDIPICLDAADATDDAQIDVSDGIRIFGFLFIGTEPPSDPFDTPGYDPTDDDDFGCLDGAEF